MRKLGRASILDVLQRAKSEFTADTKALYGVIFDYHGHVVIAFCDPISNDYGWLVSLFQVIYSSCVMTYSLGVDYDYADAFFSDLGGLQ